ncbi:MAG: FtsX-like permease family protein [Enterococcus sp.]
MLFKLLVKSFVKQTRTYFLYSGCIMLAVMTYYSFTAITYNQNLLAQTQQDVSIAGVLALGSLSVLLITLFFMLSVNRFFIKQRQAELGVYRLFGLTRQQILLLFLSETLVLMLLSFSLGIFLGAVFSKLFAMILVKVMGVAVASQLFFSPTAFYYTALVFLGMYVVLAFQNSWLLSKKRVNRLLSHNHLALPLHKMKKTWWRTFGGWLGLVFLVGGYGLAWRLRWIYFYLINQQIENLAVIVWLPLVIVFLCVVGTYLWYGLSSRLFLNYLLKKRASVGVRLYTLNQSKLRFIKNWRSLSLITLILAISITMLGVSLSVISLSKQELQNSYPVDYQVRSEDVATVTQLVTDQGGTIAKQAALEYKLTGSWGNQSLFDTEQFVRVDLINLLSLDQYQAFRKVYPKAPSIHLDTPTDAVLFDGAARFTTGLSNQERQVTLVDSPKLTLTQVYPDSFGADGMRYTRPVLVVTPAVYQTVVGETYAVDFLEIQGVEKEVLQALIDQQVPKTWGNPIYWQYQLSNQQLQGTIQAKPVADPSFNSNLRLNIASQYPQKRQAQRLAGIYLFIATFTGIIFVITIASILMLRQFAEAVEERAVYQLLRHLGVSQKQIKCLVYQQNLWVFLPPFVLASLHAFFAVSVLNQFVISSSYWLVWAFFGGFFVAMSGFYLVTVRYYLRLVTD